MYDTQEKIPVSDWITIGVILLVLIVVIVAGVTLAKDTSSSTQVISGQLVTAPVASTPLANGQKTGGGDQQEGAQQGGQIATAKDQKNINQMSFFQVFFLLLLGAAVFTVLVSVLIAVLVIQVNRVLRRMQKKTDNDPPVQ
jgi:uncharacterized membrane protein